MAQVIPIGGEVKQYQVLADPARMLAAGVTLDADADAPLFKAFAEDRVSAYLTEHPDAVELLPATVN